MDSVTGQALFKSWIEEQISQQQKKLSEQKEKVLIEKAEIVKKELIETSCSYIKIVHPPTDLRVVIYHKHFFLHFQDGCLTIWNMYEPRQEIKDTCIRDVLLQEEKTISGLSSFLVDFMKKHLFREEEVDMVECVLGKRKLC